jgi:hypothetical protein
MLKVLLSLSKGDVVLTNIKVGWNQTEVLVNLIKVMLSLTKGDVVLPNVALWDTIKVLLWLNKGFAENTIGAAALNERWEEGDAVLTNIKVCWNQTEVLVNVIKVMLSLTKGDVVLLNLALWDTIKVLLWLNKGYAENTIGAAALNERWEEINGRVLIHIIMGRCTYRGCKINGVLYKW